MGKTIDPCQGFCTLNSSLCVFKGALGLLFLGMIPFGPGGKAVSQLGIVITPFSSLAAQGKKKCAFVLL